MHVCTYSYVYTCSHTNVHTQYKTKNKQTKNQKQQKTPEPQMRFLVNKTCLHVPDGVVDKTCLHVEGPWKDAAEALDPGAIQILNAP